MFTRRFAPRLEDQFESLHVHGDRIVLNHDFPSIFSDKRYSTAHKKGGRQNHFQGLQRMGQHVLISGSYPYKHRRADLLISELGSRPVVGPWGSNLVRDWKSPPGDRLVSYFKVDGDLWHAGGPGIYDTTAVIPLEGDGTDSVIRFLDLADPADPKVIPGPEFGRPDLKAGACAITPLKSDRLLLAVWTTADQDGKVLDLYLSDEGVLANFQHVARFEPENHEFARSFQSFDFVWTRASNGAEQLYVIAFENTGKAEPIPVFSGDNDACLFKVDLAAIPKPSGGVKKLGKGFLEFVGKKTLEGAERWFNLDAGGCAYVDEDGRLIVYGVHHFMVTFRKRRSLKVVEFRSTFDIGKVTSLSDAWVELFEETALKGRRLTVLGSANPAITTPDSTFVAGARLTRVKSIRAQIPTGTSFAFFPEKGWRGTPVAVVRGTGRVQEFKSIVGADRPIRFKSARFGNTNVLGRAGADIR